MQNSFEVHGDATAIHLRRRSGDPLEAIIDTADLPLVQEYPGRFYASWSEDCQTFYCIGHKRGMRSVLLHRLIMRPEPKQEVDHLHHDGLDNRRNSLKVASRSENALNRRGARKGSKSGVRGIYWSKRLGKWRAQGRTGDGRRVDIPGSFETVQAAASAKQEWLKTA